MVMLAYLLAVVIDTAPVAVGETPAPVHVYLHPLVDQCDGRAPADEIVVCGIRDADEHYRLRPIEAGQYRDAPVRAETKLGNGKLTAHTEDHVLGAGQHSKRAMITFSVPF